MLLVHVPADLSAVIAEDGLNIENLTSKSKKDYAYTLIDVNAAVADKVVADLKAVENVIRVIVSVDCIFAYNYKFVLV